MPAPAAEPCTLDSTIFGIRLTRLDEGVIVLQQFADHGCDGVGLGGGADGLQIAAGAEGAAFALDHQHPDVVIGLDLGAELFQLLRDRQDRSS